METGLFAIVVLEWLAVVFLEHVAVTTALKAAGAFVLLAYGVFYSERLEGLAGGTGLDTIRLHLLPILAMAGVLGIVGLGDLLGAPAGLVRGIELTLVILVGGLLLPASIRLQQNVENR